MVLWSTQNVVLLYPIASTIENVIFQLNVLSIILSREWYLPFVKLHEHMQGTN